MSVTTTRLAEMSGPGKAKVPSAFTDQPAWHGDGQRQLYGDFYNLGVSIKWHDIDPGEASEWSRGFQPGSLELCLNLAGTGFIRCAESSVEFEPLTAGFYTPGKRELQARRKSGQRHCFITVEFSRRFLRDHLLPCDGALHPLVERFVISSSSSAGLGEIHRLTSDQERGIRHLLQPPSFQGARRLWYQAKVLQLMVDFFFERRGQDELFCDRQKRLARERTDRVVTLLHQRLAKPPRLDEIGREVGCSPFHLSRTFSREMGMTIPQYLRKIRMERAAELLRGGKYNVTEAALEVGYASLSHFSQAFCQTIGCCPGLYPLRVPTQKFPFGKQE